jgi:uncharacterized cupredoxin-like copper-binding protein
MAGGRRRPQAICWRSTVRARNRGHDGDRFRPDHLGFRQGVRYRLRLENSGAQLHEFTAPAFFKAIDLANPDVLAAGGQEVILQPGEWKEVYFAARQPGRYRLTCADHDWASMVGEIVIE